jgi:hypothetical protein
MQPWCRFAAEASAAGSAMGTGAGSAEAPSAERARAPSAVRQGQTSRPAAAEPFRSTSRWLRGRILDRLRDATGGTWVTFDEAIGDHDPATVTAALDRLARERLVELRSGSPIEARLPET